MRLTIARGREYTPQQLIWVLRCLHGRMDKRMTIDVSEPWKHMELPTFFEVQERCYQERWWVFCWTYRLFIPLG